MGKYIATPICKHDYQITLFGPEKERERKLAWLATQICPDCKKEDKRQSIEEHAKQYNLPDLIGIGKQTAWATQIRYREIMDLDAILARFEKSWANLTAERKQLQEEEYRKEKSLFANAKERLCKQTSAKWWIDHQYKCDALVRSWMKEAYDLSDASTP